MGVIIEQYRARIWCHNIKNTCTRIQDNESVFGDYVITIWPAAGQTVTSNIFLTLSLIFNSHLCKYDLINPPSLVMYGNTLPFTTNSTFPTFVNKHIYNPQNFQISYIYNENRTINVCYIQSCYIADTCTERVTHFLLSSDRYIHAWRAYFLLNYKLLLKLE